MSVNIVYDPVFLKHDPGDHPETPKRLQAIIESLTGAPHLSDLAWVTARDARIDELRLVHSGDHIRRIQTLSEGGGGWIDADTFVGAASFDVALRAAGACLTAVEGALSGGGSTAFCLPRPPGHHATPMRAMGFCLFNNVAVAASLALQLGAHRVAIIDFDVHHGNGTQDAFYDDPRVLYCSVHQYPFYPGTGHWREAGSGDGLGFTVNAPLPAGCGDTEYLRMWDGVLGPAIRRFGPSLILVSSGFDAHWADPLAGMNVSVPGYVALMTRINDLASELCGGRVVYVLEGGYDFTALAACATAAIELLSHRAASTDTLGPAPSYTPLDIERLVNTYRAHHGLGD